MDDLAEAADMLAEVVERGLACTIAEHKSAAVASSKEVAQRLARRLGEGKAKVHEAPPNLGIDYGAGKRRAAQGSGARRKVALVKVEARKARLRKLNEVVGQKAWRVYTTNIEPSPS